MLSTPGKNLLRNNYVIVTCWNYKIPGFRDINSLAAKVLRGKSPKMPDNYSRKLTDLVSRMLSFDSRKRPTVAQILQQRFIRDRIKIFLQKQRPNSGKNSRKSNNPPGGVKVPIEEKVPQKPPRTNISSSSSVETDFDTMQVEVKSNP